MAGAVMVPGAGLSGCRRAVAAPPKAVPLAENGELALTIASFNIRYENDGDRDWRSWPARLGRMVRTIHAMDPDILGVQEALHGQAADLWASLPGYNFYGVGRDDGKWQGEYAGIYFRRDRFEMVESGTFWLSDRPEEPGSRTWGNEIPRIASWVRLIDRASGRAFYAFNTHWDHRNQPSRERAAVLLARRIDSRSHPEDPVVLTGDFNAPENNPAVAYLGGKKAELPGAAQPVWPGALADAHQLTPPPVKSHQTLHLWRDLVPGWPKIDHILVSRGAQVGATGIERVAEARERPSDHFPVWARVVWPSSK